jgi:hypothetical protein
MFEIVPDLCQPGNDSRQKEEAANSRCLPKTQWPLLFVRFVVWVLRLSYYIVFSSQILQNFFDFLGSFLRACCAVGFFTADSKRAIRACGTNGSYQDSFQITIALIRRHPRWPVGGSWPGQIGREGTISREAGNGSVGRQTP